MRQVKLLSVSAAILLAVGTVSAFAADNDARVEQNGSHNNATITQGN